MQAGKDEELDAVIADLIDSNDTQETQTKESAYRGIGTSKTAPNKSTVTLTPRAAKQVKKIKSEESLGDDLYLRMAVEGGGCSGLSYKLGFDYKTDDDKVFESNGIEIIIDSRHLMYLNGISIDYPDGLDARGFTFDNPNAQETCGCGSSFAT